MSDEQTSPDASDDDVPVDYDTSFGRSDVARGVEEARASAGVPEASSLDPQGYPGAVPEPAPAPAPEPAGPPPGAGMPQPQQGGDAPHMGASWATPPRSGGSVQSSGGQQPAGTAASGGGPRDGAQGDTDASSGSSRGPSPKVVLGVLAAALVPAGIVAAVTLTGDGKGPGPGAVKDLTSGSSGWTQATTYYHPPTTNTSPPGGYTPTYVRPSTPTSAPVTGQAPPTVSVSPVPVPPVTYGSKTFRVELHGPPGQRIDVRISSSGKTTYSQSGLNGPFAFELPVTGDTNNEIITASVSVPYNFDPQSTSRDPDVMCRVSVDGVIILQEQNQRSVSCSVSPGWDARRR